jgi:hypothetical protein
MVLSAGKVRSYAGGDKLQRNQTAILVGTCLFLLVAQTGHAAMSDLSPLWAQKRTSVERVDQGDVRAVSLQTT